jgi:hypothetical protein
MNKMDWFIITTGLWAVAIALIIMALSSMGDHHDKSNGGRNHD